MGDAFLQITSGARSGLNIELDESRPLVIGRKRGDLIIDDPLVSSTHCRIIPKNGGWMLQDLGSTNGTMVDGRLARETTLKPGCEISVGGCKLRLYVGDQPPSGDDAPVEGGFSQLHIAWLLDEELVELASGSGQEADVIGQELRLPPGFNARVEVVSGQDLGQAFRFTRGNVSIGRRQGEVPLSDVEVSRNHAVIEVFGREMIFLRDLGSTNGTYHNGRRVSVAKLSSGDTVGVGKTVMKLQLER